ncbi:MAG: asparaginase [Bacillota bacterium]|jgi:L-asparaginase
MKKILVITTGGTIASQETSSGGLSPQIGADGLLSFVPELSSKYEIHTLPILNIESSDLEPEQWLIMINAVKANYENYDGFVITHGTDTLAFTSAALTYLIRNSAKPIVITGSQLPIDYPLTDAKKNLTDSCRIAAEDNFPGVYVVFDGKVILGSRARKVNSISNGAFDSINYPLAAKVYENKICRYQVLPQPVEPVCFGNKLENSVVTIKITPGMTAESVAAIGSYYKAVILESYGVGGIPRPFLPVIEQWYNEGKVIAATSQVTYEGTDLEVYTVGNEISRRFDAIQTYDMTLAAAVAKLMCILPQTKNSAEVKEMFYKTIDCDIFTA